MSEDVSQTAFLKLDQTDAVCKKVQELTGHPVSYEKYLFLLAHAEDKDVLEQLLSPLYESEQSRLREAFRKKYYENGYLDSQLIPKGFNVTAEKLPRYVVIPEHSHDFVEIACVLHGECRHIVEGCEFLQETGSVAYINAFARHQLIAVEDALCFTIKVRREFFLNLKLPYMLSFITPIMFHCGEDLLIRDLVLSLFEQNNETQSYRPQMSDLLFETLMYHIGQKYRDRMERMYYSPLLDQQIISILDYMVENYRTVTLHSMAEHFHYSETYLSRMFHEKTGATFSQRLREFKLEQAAGLLRETNKKLDDICDTVGYADVTQFIHNFKEKHQQTPGQYRKETRKKEFQNKISMA